MTLPGGGGPRPAEAWPDKHCAICHGVAPLIQSMTSNASFRNCSPLYLKAKPHECVPGATAPVTITGS